jgi:hypothetical protein
LSRSTRPLNNGILIEFWGEIEKEKQKKDNQPLPSEHKDQVSKLDMYWPWFGSAQTILKQLEPQAMWGAHALA